MMQSRIAVFLLLVGSVFFSCSNNAPETSAVPQAKVEFSVAEKKNKDLALIQELETKLEQNKDDKTTANQLLMTYIDFTNNYHDDPMSENYLMKGASLADGLGKYPKAIELLINYHEGYPNGKRKDEAAYLVAFIYDAHIGDKQKATTYYNKVIELYPQSKWAEQARSALKIVNMSDEELIKFLDEKNKK